MPPAGVTRPCRYRQTRLMLLSSFLVCVWNGVPSLLSRSQSHFESAAEAQVSRNRLTCIVHLSRYCLSFCGWEERQALARELPTAGNATGSRSLFLLGERQNRSRMSEPALRTRSQRRGEASPLF
jgi:hypothetical protein